MPEDDRIRHHTEIIVKWYSNDEGSGIDYSIRGAAMTPSIRAMLINALLREHGKTRVMVE